MLRVVCTIALLSSAAAASAQAATTPAPAAGPGSAGYDGAFNTIPFDTATVLGSVLTPTMERDRTRQALALRTEAVALQTADGGTLSQRHQWYINRKARAILHD